MDLTYAPATEIGAAVRAGKARATDVARHFLERAKELDGKLNSFVTINEGVVDEAEKIDRAVRDGKDPGPLAGVPVAVKDLLCTKGMRTTACSKILSNFVPPYSATVVENLRNAGAVVLGKTSLDEFAMGSSNETSCFGPVRNPWDLERVPGGSSGGSAAALAARLAPLAIGTDTGGSIRQPASFCGVYGIKPTYGRVSRFGIIAFASSLDQAGPMANTTLDCAAALEAISGADGWDSTCAPNAVPKWATATTGEAKGLRIGLPKEYFSEKIDDDVKIAIDRSIATLKGQGAEFVDVSLSLVKHAVQVYYLIATSEASSNLARYDGIRFGHRAALAAGAKDLDDLYSASRGEGFGSEVKRRIMLGTYALSSGYYDAYYQKACQVRALMKQEFTRAFQACDAILSPVTASPAFRIGERIQDPLEMYLNDIFTTSTNLAGLPGMSVPAGFSSRGLPIGVQLTAKHFDEQTLFNISLALERALPQEERRPHVV